MRPHLERIGLAAEAEQQHVRRAAAVDAGQGLLAAVDDDQVVLLVVGAACAGAGLQLTATGRLSAS